MTTTKEGTSSKYIFYKSKKDCVSQEKNSDSNSSVEKDNKIKTNRNTKNLDKESNINIKGINSIKGENKKYTYIVQNKKTDIRKFLFDE